MPYLDEALTYNLLVENYHFK